MVSFIKDSSVHLIWAKERSPHIPFSIGRSEIPGLWSSGLIGLQIITSGPKPVQYPALTAISGLSAIFSKVSKMVWAHIYKSAW